VCNRIVHVKYIYERYKGLTDRALKSNHNSVCLLLLLLLMMMMMMLVSVDT